MYVRFVPPRTRTQKQTHRVQKKTRLAGTIDNLPSFNKYKCDRSHIHSVAIGSCVVNGVRFNRSKAAGAYPSGLCSVLAGIVVEHLSSDSPFQSSADRRHVLVFDYIRWAFVLLFALAVCWPLAGGVFVLQQRIAKSI